MESLTMHPEAGKLIPGSGGLRIIYFWWLSDEKILLLDVYAKGEREDLNPEQIRKLQRKVIQ